MARTSVRGRRGPGEHGFGFRFDGENFGFGPGEHGRGFEFFFDGENFREGRRGPGGRGFGFRFDGEEFNFEDLEKFFDGFEGAIPPEGAFNITCQNSEGDTVFSLSFSGPGGLSIENFALPEMGGLDFESLDCQITEDASVDTGDL